MWKVLCLWLCDLGCLLESKLASNSIPEYMKEFFLIAPGFYRSNASAQYEEQQLWFCCIGLDPY